MTIDRPLLLWDEPRPADLGADADEMLTKMQGPTVLRVAGADRHRRRIVVTLLHGNEPSGLRALHAWLRSEPRPRVDALCVVAAVEAARRMPPFSQRWLADGADLNRCFRAPFRGVGGELAAAILRLVESSRAEALVDLHNNTGHNPPYAIATRLDATRMALAALFTDRLVFSDLRLGALMEAVEDVLPSVTIECGRAGDGRADEVALRGIQRFFALERIAPVAEGEPAPVILEEPVPIRIRAGVRLAIGMRAQPGADLTIAADLDRHNFEELAAGTCLGWVAAPSWPVTALDATGRDRCADFFTVAEGELRARRAWIPIMMTNDPVIAVQDCLFYIVRQRQPAQS